MSLDAISGGMPECIFQLDSKQRAAALDLNGPIMISAKPGSGKTRCIASRVALLLYKGVPQERILCFTFTNRAANEMRQRIELYSGQSIENMRIGTFHSICARLLRYHAPDDLVPHNFGICDDSQSGDLVKSAIRIRCNDYARVQVGDMKMEISRFKRSLMNLEDWCDALACKRGEPYAERFRSVYSEYQTQLRQMNMLDFDDLTLNTVNMLHDYPDIRTFLASTFMYICVDEYQDTAAIEAELIRLLSSVHGNLCVVGDINQSIYSWRGSNPQLMIDFPVLYPKAKTHILDTNYRSGRAIVATAERLMESGTGCRPHRLDAGEVTYTRYHDDNEEADAIARRIQDIVASGISDYSDIAVLSRMHILLRPIRQILCDRNIPCTVSRETDDTELDDNAVRLLTIHQAKGLEFKTVFLIGLEEGVLPCSHSLHSDALEEERRLCYVAMTRATDLLVVSSCNTKSINASRRNFKESRFIALMQKPFFVRHNLL